MFKIAEKYFSATIPAASDTPLQFDHSLQQFHREKIKTPGGGGNLSFQDTGLCLSNRKSTTHESGDISQKYTHKSGEFSENHTHKFGNAKTAHQ